MASLSKIFVLVCVAGCLGVCALATLGCDDGDIGVVPCAAADSDPIAIISYLPETISNGTLYTLNGSESWDPQGDQLIHSWVVSRGNDTWILVGVSPAFRFTDEGLYKIMLTVRDDDGNTGYAFTAVVSVDDSDFDEMPDWWELAYFDTLAEVPTGDPDGDGYTNLQEYADGNDPTVADPPPLGPGFLEENWLSLVVVAAVAVGVMLAMYPRIKRKRKALETKKIEYAIELEKSLDEE